MADFSSWLAFQHILETVAFQVQFSRKQKSTNLTSFSIRSFVGFLGKHPFLFYFLLDFAEYSMAFQLLLSSFNGKNPMSDRTRIHVHSLKLNARDTQTVGPIL